MGCFRVLGQDPIGLAYNFQAIYMAEMIQELLERSLRHWLTGIALKLVWQIAPIYGTELDFLKKILSCFQS